jgi:hypothetical protein
MVVLVMVVDNDIGVKEVLILLKRVGGGGSFATVLLG